MFFSVCLLFTTIICVHSFSPSCGTCKFFISNNKKEDLGLCSMFPDAVYYNNEKTLQQNLAVHCRNDENLCGKSGFAYEHANANDDDFVEKTNLEKLEKIERELINALQQMRRYQLKTIYNAPNCISRLVKKITFT